MVNTKSNYCSVRCVILLILYVNFYVFLDAKRTPLSFDYDANVRVLTIRKPGVNMEKDWTITIEK